MDSSITGEGGGDNNNLHTDRNSGMMATTDNLKTASTTKSDTPQSNPSINAIATTTTTTKSQLSTIDMSMPQQPQPQPQPQQSSSSSSIFRQHDTADGGSNGNNGSSALSAINNQHQPQHEQSLQEQEQSSSSYQFSTPSRKFSPSQQQQQTSSPSPRRFLGSQSFGAGPGSHHRHNNNNNNSVPPRGRPINIDSSPSPQTQQQQRYSASETLSSITYSGYLYKRSNYPHRDPSTMTTMNNILIAPSLVDPNVIVIANPDADPDDDNTESFYHGYHSNDNANTNNRFNNNQWYYRSNNEPLIIDPARSGSGMIPDFNTAVPPGSSSGSGSGRGRGRGGGGGGGGNDTNDGVHASVDFWPDLDTPAATTTARTAAGISTTANTNSGTDTYGVKNVTPSPSSGIVTSITNQNQDNSNLVQRQNYGSIGTTATTTAATAAVSSIARQQDSSSFPNPIQLLNDSIESFFRTNFVGKDERDEHRTESSSLQPQQQLQRQQQQQQLEQAGPSKQVTDSTPLLAAGLVPRPSSQSRPIKFSSPSSTSTASDEQDDTFGYDNRTRARQQQEIFSTKYGGADTPPRQQNKRESFVEAQHRRYSAPIDMLSNSNGSRTTRSSHHSDESPVSQSLLVPDDFYDPRDGHLWRAKYCVLEDGCLYFYRNKNDGDSAEATAERKRSNLSMMGSNDCIMDDDSSALNAVPPMPQAQSFQHRTSIESAARRSSEASSNMSRISSQQRRSSAKDLSKSPMPVGRHILHHFDSNGLADLGPCMWEKRVFMDCVGGVRTAEQFYGLNSFELQALDDEDESNHVDTLVLQAPNQPEMKEWIFQFHRSLASVMMNIMHVFGSTPAASLLNRTAYLDIQHPSLNINSSKYDAYGGSSGIPHSPSDKHLSRLIAMSPRFYSNQMPTQQPLSHGHGRHSLRRRRSDLKKPGTPPPMSDDYGVGTTSLSSTPETGDTAGSPRHQFPFREPSPGPGHAAEEISPPSRLLLPPPIIQNSSLRNSALDMELDEKAKTNHKKGSSADVEPFLVPETPELSAPLSIDPETERPKPATGKYIPPHLRNRQQNQEEQSSSSTTSAYVPPHLRRKQQETVRKKYVPPHLRGANIPAPSSLTEETEEITSNGHGTLSLAERAKLAPATPPRSDDVLIPSSEKATKFERQQELLDVVGPVTIDFIRGGCADPDHVQGSIMDPMFIPKKASRVGKVQADAHGSYGGGPLNDNEMATGSSGKSSLRWETGAVSECGIRDSNEDSFLIAGDLLSAFGKESLEGSLPVQQMWKPQDADHNLGLFAVFDGHCGNHAARFSVERLTDYINNELQLKGELQGVEGDLNSALSALNVESVLREAIMKMDNEFCHLCHLDGRQWESGATALVAMVANEHLVIGNLGDCRGVLCRVVSDTEPYQNDETWSALDSDEHISERITPSSSPSAQNQEAKIFWKEITHVHSPSAEHERARIEKANGWITTETEIPIGQLRRMDFLDEDVIEILQRCFSVAGGSNSDRLTPGADSEKSIKECKAAPQRILTISRICGELSVSRALGDRDFKAAFNNLSEDMRDSGIMEDEEESNLGNEILKWWDSPLFLPYPDEHSRRFQGDLVSNTPEFQKIRVGDDGVSDEFVILSCDGLWDVMDADDAVRIARNLLYKKKWTAKKTAARLAELAIHLGSSDNVTVVIIRLFSKEDNIEGKK